MPLSLTPNTPGTLILTPLVAAGDSYYGLGLYGANLYGVGGGLSLVPLVPGTLTLTPRTPA